MSVAILLVLPIFLSGYIYGRRAHHVKLKLIRRDGYHLYFTAATIGVLFVVLSTVLVISFDYLNLSLLGSIVNSIREAFNHTFNIEIDSKSHFSVVVIGLLSMILSWVAPYVSNKIWSAKECYEKSINDNDFELLLYENVGNAPISFSMENGKVYIGLVIRGIRPEEEERTHIRILPLRSGFRNKNSGLVKFTTYYWEVYEKLDLVPIDPDLLDDDDFDDAVKTFFKNTADYQVILPADDIKAAHIFDEEAFKEFEKIGESAKDDKIEIAN